MSNTPHTTYIEARIPKYELAALRIYPKSAVPEWDMADLMRKREINPRKPFTTYEDYDADCIVIRQDAWDSLIKFRKHEWHWMPLWEARKLWNALREKKRRAILFRKFKPLSATQPSR